MKLPAGKYWIGDPCYVIDPDKWQDFCDVSFAGHKQIPVTYFNGHKMFAYGTAFGDGCFLGSDGVRYGVDAGMLSIVPIELCASAEYKHLGTIHVFKDEFEAFEEDGTFYFGNIEIQTGDSPESEGEEDYEDEED